MCVASKNETMVKGRATGRMANMFSKRNHSFHETPLMYTNDVEQASRNESSLSTLTEQASDLQLRLWSKNTKHMDSYMALTGATGVMKKDPMAAINRVIKWEKPFIEEACKPRQTYLNFQKWAPKHARKLFQVEDVYNAYQDTDTLNHTYDTIKPDSRRTMFNSTLHQYPNENLFQTQLNATSKREMRSQSNIQISESNAMGLIKSQSRKTLIPMQEAMNLNENLIERPESRTLGDRLHVRGVPKSLMEFQSRNLARNGSQSNLEIVKEKSNMVVLPKVKIGGDTSIPLSSATGGFEKRVSVAQSTANIS